ncbi:MAG: hypothetical protein KGL39_55340 [Patescibacteria group bacterium]|nr:hypothetical protein [Patescibacteria group bacterium]
MFALAAMFALFKAAWHALDLIDVFAVYLWRTKIMALTPAVHESLEAKLIADIRGVIARVAATAPEVIDYMHVAEGFVPQPVKAYFEAALTIEAQAAPVLAEIKALVDAAIAATAALPAV